MEITPDNSEVMMKVFLPFKALDALENAEYLDGVAAVLQTALRKVIRTGNVKDVLHGVPTGHPLHPMAVQLPIGAWTSAVVLDFVPGAGKASRVLIAIGVLSAAPAVLSGWADWLELHPQQQRVGVVHSAANATGTLLFGTSLVLRCCGRIRAGTIASTLGLATIAVGGTLGGQLAYRQAAGANHAEAVPHLVAPGWHRVGEVGEFTTGKLQRRMVGNVPVIVWRSANENIAVISNECSHLSGPLSEGTVTDVNGDPCVECPWHHSRFSLATGQVMGGPATSPQAAFKTRVVNGMVEVSLPHAG
ncbi:(2Fe-2S)-binding protein [Arthrobacter alpinus]|uniref:(2Fe-2S)-binding protein n=1 Tax=Arthrobacter alpinus TaxID=656366 RepID=A0A0M4R137_9MICC|nr:Rieske 2Fe-2S domain-containing protein [Arthrobacter alpinus]ALE93790.1 (2Fe-2S)-binding protein [Arthrobacter alpinus]